MTEIRHIAWYNLVIANVHLASGSTSTFFIFTGFAVLLFILSFIGERR